ncbi:MAG TPA: FkbM family methyltransferase [Phycisphaerales bacterium]|nr:FkbM family methyltransferase [Phycisphaerales bacterium]
MVSTDSISYGEVYLGLLIYYLLKVVLMKVSTENLLKGLVNLMCCFVPGKKSRKRLRYELVGIKKERNDLLDAGFTIDGETITTPQGVKIDISNIKDHPLYLVKVVFVKSEYNLNIKRDSILIDIGMNRAAVSLLFAADENVKKVYAYEPFKPTFEVAKKNLQLNPQLSEKINAFCFGLGKSEKTLEMPYMDDATGGMSTTHEVCKDQEGIKKETVVVKDAAEVIGGILEENKDKHIIVKCDCEGAEFEIFERLKEKDLIGKLDVVMMEYHFENPDRLIDILTEKTFAVQTKIGSRRSKTGYIYAVRMTEK